MQGIADSAAALDQAPPADGYESMLTKAAAEEFDHAADNVRHSFRQLQGQVSRNVAVLVPSAAKAAGRAAELHKENAALTADTEAAQSATAEAASKLRQTQVALHQSHAGHSNIASTFPLSLEIAEKVKTFGSSDHHNRLLLELLLEKSASMAELTNSMFSLHTFCQVTVSGAFQARETTIMGALNNIERSPLIDGFMRRCAA